MSERGERMMRGGLGVVLWWLCGAAVCAGAYFATEPLRVRRLATIVEGTLASEGVHTRIAVDPRTKAPIKGVSAAEDVFVLENGGLIAVVPAIGGGPAATLLVRTGAKAGSFQVSPLGGPAEVALSRLPPGLVRAIIARTERELLGLQERIKLGAGGGASK